MKKTMAHKRTLYRAIGFGLILALAVIVLGPKIDVLHSSLRTIANADVAFTGWALLALSCSYLVSAATYCFLAIVRLRFWPTVVVQIADSFTNRLLPASIGGIATNFLYLVRQKHTKVKASFVVSADNLLGFLGHSLLLVCLLIASSKPVQQLFVWRFPSRGAAWVIVLGLIVMVYLAFAQKALLAVKKTLLGLINVGRTALIHPMRLFLALLSSMVTTITYGLMLYFSMLAVNVHVSLLQAFLALTIGVAAIAITPTPGGLGGAEAGLAAGLTGMGVPAHQALSAALMYRLISFWLPIIPGFLALQFSIRRRYIKSIYLQI